MKKLFILGLISLSMNAVGPVDQNLLSPEGVADDYVNQHEHDYDPVAAQQLRTKNAQLAEEAEQKLQRQKLINQINSEGFNQNTEFSSQIKKLYKAFFNSDYDGAGFSTEVNFNDDPWNKLAPAIFASQLRLNSADLKPRLGGLSNWVRQLFGGQKLTPEQRFKERLIQALIKKAIEYINYQNTLFNVESNNPVKAGYLDIIKYLSNAFAKKAFDIKNININKLYNDIVGKVQNSYFLNDPRIILANLNLILSLNSNKNKSDKSINFSKAFESLYRDTAENIFKAMQNLVINDAGTIKPVAWNDENYAKIAKLILDQLPSVALKKALIELSKANSTKPINRLNINDLLKQIIDNPNAKALKGPDGKLLIKFESGNPSSTGQGSEDFVKPIEIQHKLGDDFGYDDEAEGFGE